MITANTFQSPNFRQVLSNQISDQPPVEPELYSGDTVSLSGSQTEDARTRFFGLTAVGIFSAVPLLGALGQTEFVRHAQSEKAVKLGQAGGLANLVGTGALLAGASAFGLGALGFGAAMSLAGMLKEESA